MQAFRREKSPVFVTLLRLNGLDPAAQYKLTNFDAKGFTKVSGRELMESGLTLEITNKPGAVIITYQRVK
jgi:hypothetical protein